MKQALEQAKKKLAEDEELKTLEANIMENEKHLQDKLNKERDH